MEYIPLTHAGQLQTLGTYAGITVDELQLTLRSSFGLDEPVAALLDEASSRYFPVSLLALAPSSFARLGVTAPLTLVLAEGSDFTAEEGKPSCSVAEAQDGVACIACVQLIRAVRFYCSDGLLNDERLALVLKDLWASCPAPAETMALAQIELARIFAVFDRDGTSQIAAHDFIAAASTLCGGARDAKVAATFALYDGDGDGHLSQGEVQRYLMAIFSLRDSISGDGESPEMRAVRVASECFARARTNADGLLSFDAFREWYGDAALADADLDADVASDGSSGESDDVQQIFAEFDLDRDGCLDYAEATEYFASVFGRLYAATPGMANDMGVSALELAEDTAQECFAACGVDDSGRLSFEEFSDWYYDYEEPSTLLPYEGGGSSNSDTLATVRAMTTLAQFDAAQIIRAFGGGRGKTIALDLEAFVDTMVGFLTEACESNAQTRLDGIALFERLFDVFDADHNGVVSAAELAAGLAVLCGGGGDEKVRSTFTAFDADGDGFLSLDEMISYLAAVFRMRYETASSWEINATPDELAIATAEECFADAGLHGDGELSFEAFYAWYTASSGGESTTTQVVVAVEVAPQQQPTAELAGLHQTRAALGLIGRDVNDIFELFAQFTDFDGTISRDSFQMCFGQLVDPFQSDAGQLSERVARLYDVFDTNGDGMVDFTELACGLSVLCDGSRDDKARAAFALYDIDGDGVISLEEMTRYLTSVFRVLYELQPGTRESMGDASPEDLAYVTAQQAFEDADANHDGVLSWDEFQAWYTSSLPDDSGESGEPQQQQQQQQLKRCGRAHVNYKHGWW